MVTTPDRKDPRHKDGNAPEIPLLNPTGFDAWHLLLEQKILTGGKGRAFPNHHKSAGTAFVDEQIAKFAQEGNRKFNCSINSLQ